jgi:hypothetical protein
MKNLTLLAFLLLSTISLLAQNNPKMTSTLPYREIPAYPENYSGENVVARMIDGLGFRFYWATEGLRPEDLAFRPTPESRSSEETIDHILGLSTIVLSALKNQPNVRSGEETSPLTFEVKRKKTLEVLQEASNLLKQADTKLDNHSMVYDWRIRAEKPFLKLMTPLLRPIFSANHLWAMRKGEESIRLELMRRQAKSAEDKAKISPPPGPTFPHNVMNSNILN